MQTWAQAHVNAHANYANTITANAVGIVVAVMYNVVLVLRQGPITGIAATKICLWHELHLECFDLHLNVMCMCVIVLWYHYLCL